MQAGSQPQKESKDYKEKAQQRKQQKVDNLWGQINTNAELKVCMCLSRIS